MYWQVRSLMSIHRFCVTRTWFMSGVVPPEHLDLFEKGIAKKLDYSYSGPRAARIARMLFSGKIELGAIDTYLELFARYFVDLTPQAALIAAVSADRDGNLYTGPNTEDTPTVVERPASPTVSSLHRSTRSSIRCRGSIFPAIRCTSSSTLASRSMSNLFSAATRRPLPKGRF
jgi:hypothetical protein